MLNCFSKTTTFVHGSCILVGTSAAALLSLTQRCIVCLYPFLMGLVSLQALRVGQLMEKRSRECALNGMDGAPLSKIRCRAAPRSCMPYSTYWASKIAI